MQEKTTGVSVRVRRASLFLRALSSFVFTTHAAGPAVKKCGESVKKYLNIRMNKNGVWVCVPAPAAPAEEVNNKNGGRTGDSGGKKN